MLSEQTLREYDMCVRVSDTLGHRISRVGSSALLSAEYYLGIRISELVGDRARAYETKEGTKFTKEAHGLRKMDITVEGEYLRVDPKEVRKHGYRTEPLWIKLSNEGVDDILKEFK